MNCTNICEVEKTKKNSGLLKFFFSMFKIGLIGFGGGNALIPILFEKTVEENQSVTEEEFNEEVLVASLTPGALPVEIAGGVGQRRFGIKGMLLGAVGMSLPGVILSIIILALFGAIDENAMLQIKFATVGVSAFIAMLLSLYVKDSVCNETVTLYKGFDCLVIVAVFLAVGTRNIYKFLGFDSSNIIKLKTIDVFAAAFVVIIIYAIIKKVKNRRNAIGNADFKFEKITGTEKISLFWLFILLVIAGLISICISRELSLFWAKGLLSSLMSFGGGDAYLAVAEGLFVESGLITENQFYGMLVPTVNILPGSILCKTLTGTGFLLGSSVGSYEAYLYAFIGYVTSVLASCSVFYGVHVIYTHFRDLTIFKTIKRWIRPIVSGLMLSVILSLACQTKKIGSGLENILFLAVMAGLWIFGVSAYSRKMKKTTILSVCIISSLLLCNLINIIF